eukprot:COSAG04_NODE_24191_length_325_cov_1.269912_1_plen_37_part_01
MVVVVVCVWGGGGGVSFSPGAASLPAGPAPPGVGRGR